MSRHKVLIASVAVLLAVLSLTVVVPSLRPVAIRHESPPRASFESAYRAATTDDAVQLRDYLARGGNPNQRNVDGETLLHTAVAHGARNAAAVLLHYGADPNVTAPSAHGRTPLHFSTSRGSTVTWRQSSCS